MENPAELFQPGQPLDPGQLQPPPENDSQGTSGTPVENSGVQKIMGAAKSAYESVKQKIKPGRGRPRKDGLPKSSDTVAEDPVFFEHAQPPTAVFPPSAGDLLIRKAIGSAAKGCIGIAKQVIEIQADAAGLDSAFTEKALTQASPDQETLDGFNESIQLVCEKYKLTTEYAPEISLAIYGGRIATPFFLLLRTFSAEIKRKRALENPQPPKP